MSKPRTLVAMFEKLEGFLQKLPGSLAQPILREITPIKTLFLLQRPPRIVLVGSRTATKAQFCNALFGSEVLDAEDESVHDGTWREIAVGESTRSHHDGQHSGALRVLDARRPVSLAAAETALGRETPDLFVFLRGSSEIDQELAADLQHAVQLLEYSAREGESVPRILGLQYGADEAAREQLHATLHTELRIEAGLIGSLALADDPAHIDAMVELLGVELPPETQLEIARISGNRRLQTQIAEVLLRSVSTICGAIGAQPIPLADFPILTSLQTGMVAGIMHISGRGMSVRLAGEFLGALGTSIGAGFLMREGARAVVKLVPVWGNVISGGVAAAGTYGIGRAAVAYFIQGVSLEDARRVFKRPKKLLKSS